MCILYVTACGRYGDGPERTNTVDLSEYFNPCLGTLDCSGLSRAERKKTKKRKKRRKGITYLSLKMEGKKRVK